jgi:anti-sigma-K factor RskA
VEDAKAYIESGILELYVMGQLSASEMAEVETRASISPEIKQEIEAIEIALEHYALKTAVMPKIDVFANIEAAITANAETKTAEPLSSSIPYTTPLHQDSTTMPVTKSIRPLQYALAACVALLVISGIALLNAHSKLDAANQQILSLRTEKDRYASGMNVLKKTNSELQRVADMVDDPNWAIVKLAGTKTAPNAKMMVYWNRRSQDVVVDKSRLKLPENNQSQQYQLWAMVAGKPVDLGVFDVTADSTDMLIKMKEIAKAEAFAVTLEKRGGSVNPTMENMVVFAGVSI